MNYFRLALFLGWVLFALPAVAWGQPQAEAEAGREYVVQYVLVVVLVGLAMFAICKPSPRAPNPDEQD